MRLHLLFSVTGETKATRLHMLHWKTVVSFHCYISTKPSWVLKEQCHETFYFFHLPICLAMRVLPVPGGPNSRIPFTCLQPSCSIISGGNTREAKARLKICSIVSGTRQSAQQKTLHMYAPQLLHNLRRKNHCFESRSGWIRAVSSIRIRVWKVRIRPNINSCDLTDGFDKVLDFGGTWPKKTVLRVLDMKYNIFFYLYQYPSFRTFFSRIRIRIFPDRIRILADQDPDPDSEKRSDPDPDPGKNPGSETLGKTQDAKECLKICFIVSGTWQSAQQNNHHMLAHKLLHNLRRKYLECKITPKIFVLLYQVNGRPHNRLTVTCLHPIISDGKTREPWKCVSGTRQSSQERNRSQI